MKRFVAFLGFLGAIATLSIAFTAIPESTNMDKQGEIAASKSDLASPSIEEADIAAVESPTSHRFDEPLPGLEDVLSRIPDEDQRVQLESSIESYRDSVDLYKESLRQLPPPVAKALLAGDEDTVAKAAAEAPTIIEQIVTVQERYTDVTKTRDAVTVAIAAIGSPTVAADVYRILAIIDSGLPDAEKFRKILEVIARRLLFLLKAMAAAETGSVSSDLIGGVAEDLDVVRGAFTRLVTGGDDGGGSSLEAYLPDGTKIDFQLPDDINLQRIQDLVNSENSIEFSVQGGQPTLRVISSTGDVLLLVTQPDDGPALIIVD